MTREVHIFFMLAGLGIVLFLNGCSFHEVNVAASPSVEIQDAFPSLENTEEAQNKRNKQPWWHELGKPYLSAIIEKSFTGNYDIAAAFARIHQARALQLQTRADLFPLVTLEGNVADRRQGSVDLSSTYDVGAAFNWEVDLFHRISMAAQADELETLARVEDLNALRLSLSTDIASAYFGAIAANNRLTLLRSQVETDLYLQKLLELRQKSGVGTTVDVLQQKSQVAESSSLIPLAESELRVFENRLDVLLGQGPDGLNRVNSEETLTFASALPVVGVPADLLLNRPDLRSSRAELVAADAEIGAAIADRLPKLTLTGSYLYSDSTTFSGLAGLVMGSFIQPILDWGQRKAVVEENKALYRERLADFTQLYLKAVEQVENALYQENKQREYITRLEERRKILLATEEETRALYTQGLVNYLPVLHALQELRGVERDLITERLRLIDYRIALYHAIGGVLPANTPQQTKPL